jgi:hypothetical protein
MCLDPICAAEASFLALSTFLGLQSRAAPQQDSIKPGCGSGQMPHETANREGYRLLTNADIAAAVREGNGPPSGRRRNSVRAASSRGSGASVSSTSAASFKADGQLKPVTEGCRNRLVLEAPVFGLSGATHVGNGARFLLQSV